MLSTGALEPTGVAVTVEDVISAAVAGAGVQLDLQLPLRGLLFGHFDGDHALALTSVGGSGATSGGSPVSR